MFLKAKKRIVSMETNHQGFCAIYLVYDRPVECLESE